MSAKDGGPAFPFSALTPEGPQIYADCQGMTLRQWYAGLALIQLAPEKYLNHAQRAACAYEIADAMLAEGAKEQP